MAMPVTQHTLIQRLRDPADQEAWQRFESGHRELVVRFAMRRGLQRQDAEDVAQAEFAVAAAFGMSQEAVHEVKQRMRDRMRERHGAGRPRIRPAEDPERTLAAD